MNALAAATKAALEKRGEEENTSQVCNRAAEQQAGTAEKTRPQSRGNGVDESQARTAPATATPTRALAGKAKDGGLQKMSEPTAGRRYTATKSEKSGHDSLRQVPRYMRPLNRQVSALAKQMESVKERVASLRTSLHAKAQKASLDSAPVEEPVVEPDL